MEMIEDGYYGNKKDRHLVYKWFNVQTVGELKESLKLLSDETKIDVDLRLIKSMKSNKGELQFKKSERY